MPRARLGTASFIMPVAPKCFSVREQYQALAARKDLVIVLKMRPIGSQRRLAMRHVVYLLQLRNERIVPVGCIVDRTVDLEWTG